MSSEPLSLLQERVLGLGEAPLPGLQPQLHIYTLPAESRGHSMGKELFLHLQSLNHSLLSGLLFQD